MKLRMQLALAFLLLAVIPLSLISLYSYTSSLRALRQAAEVESDSLAADMSGRLASVSRDLSRRVGNLGDLNFRRPLEQNRQEFTTQAEALANQVQAVLGDYASLLKSVEFTPVRSESAQSPAPGSSSGAAAQQPQKVAESGGILINLSGDTSGAAAAKVQPETDQAGRMTLNVGVPSAQNQEQKTAANEQAQAKQQEEIVKKLVDNAKEVGKLAQQQAQLDSMDTGRNRVTRGRPIAPLPMDGGSEIPRAPGSGQLAAEVRNAGEVVGKISAQVSTGEILRNVLRGTERRQGEIPFVIDAEGHLLTTDPKDVAQVEALPLEVSIKRTTPPTTENQADKWVVRTRQDSASGATFGIARPIGDRLSELRQTAVRNLAYGLGMVGLALIGIIPLSGKMTRNLETLTQCAEKLARGDLQARASVPSKNEFGQLAQAFNHMAQTLSENEKKLVEQERLSKEMEMCRQIQVELLPKGIFCTGIVEAEGISIPAREVGGDFFNYFPLADGSVAFLVGDVSGKGLPAAMLMANLQATIRARLPLELDLAKLAEELDLSIKESTPPELYLTLFIGVFDSATMTLRYVNAGHNTQFAISAEGEVGYLESTGRPLGLLPGGGYTEVQVELGSGDSLFFYTDGLVETFNSAGEEFGMDRLEALVLKERRGANAGMLVRIEKAVQEYRGEAEIWDDATMLLVQIGMNYPS